MDVAPHTPRNLFEVKRKLATLEMDNRLRADLSSAINAVGKTQLMKPAESVDDILQTISVDAAGLASILHKRTGARFGYTKEGWRNIGWRVRRALRLTGAWDLFHAKKIELSPEWAHVVKGAKPSYLRVLARWAMQNGITPAELNDTHLDPFFRWLLTWKIRDYARRCYAEAIREWNRAASGDPNWPGAPLTHTTVRKEHYSVAHNRWPDELLCEVDAIISRFAEPDIDDQEGHENAAPLTLKTHRSVLMRTLSAYSVGSSVPPEQITTVEVLMNPKNAKIAFDFMLKWRQKTKPEIQKTSEIHGAAKLVSKLAMQVFRQNIPADHVLELQQMARRRNPKRKGLSKKNRDIQRLFDDESFEARFLHKPFQIMEELVCKPKTRKAAVSAMVTLAVAMSIEAPIRPGNQELLILGQHVWRFRRGNEECLAIRLPADEVKNDEDLDFELTGPIVGVFDVYIDKFRPREVCT